MTSDDGDDDEGAQRQIYVVACCAHVPLNCSAYCTPSLGHDARLSLRIASIVRWCHASTERLLQPRYSPLLPPMLLCRFFLGLFFLTPIALLKLVQPRFVCAVAQKPSVRFQSYCKCRYDWRSSLHWTASGVSFF